MNKRLVFVAATVALGLVFTVALAYRLHFGGSLAASSDSWGQFGDFFGGMLNPLFAMLAFLALLWSISLQAEEFRRASGHLEEQSSLARRQLEALNSDRLSQELLHVIKDIDERLNELLKVPISTAESPVLASVSMMASEAGRLARSSGQSASYSAFIAQATHEGSVVEAIVREVATLVLEMRGFLEQWSKVRAGAYAPVIEYYANKVYGLTYMLEDAKCIPEDTRQFFATVSDPHS